MFVNGCYLPIRTIVVLSELTAFAFETTFPDLTNPPGAALPPLPPFPVEAPPLLEDPELVEGLPTENPAGKTRARKV